MNAFDVDRYLEAKRQIRFEKRTDILVAVTAVAFIGLLTVFRELDSDRLFGGILVGGLAASILRARDMPRETLLRIVEAQVNRDARAVQRAAGVPIVGRVGDVQDGAR